MWIIVVICICFTIILIFLLHLEKIVVKAILASKVSSIENTHFALKKQYEEAIQSHSMDGYVVLQTEQIEVARAYAISCIEYLETHPDIDKSNYTGILICLLEKVEDNAIEQKILNELCR